MLIVEEGAYGSSGLRWRALAASVLVAVAVVAAANFAAWKYLQTYPVNPGLARVWIKWRMIDHEHKPVDWLILGDSTCLHGIVPDVIRSETGGTALNLCTLANAMVVNDAWQLEYYINKVGVPRNVVLFHAYHVWYRGISDFLVILDQIPVGISLYKSFSPPLNIGFFGDIDFLTRPIRTFYISNVSVDYAITHELTRLFQGGWARTDINNALQGVLSTRGYIGNGSANAAETVLSAQKAAKDFANRDFVLSPENAAALKAICELSQKYKFKLYLANSSIARMLYEDPGFERYYQAMVSKLSSEVDSCPGMTYVMKIPPQFEPSEMENETHVATDPIAARLTRDLMAAVKSGSSVAAK
jgi:hypothetical protein